MRTPQNTSTAMILALSKFIPDNHDASSRTHMLINRPRTAGVSLEMKL